MANKQTVIETCLKREPNPEHGPGQYEVVYDYLHEEYPDFRDLTDEDAVEMVLEHMQMGED